MLGRKSRKPKFIPESYVRGLRDYGEHLMGQRPNFNAGLVSNLEMLDFAQDDPDGFVDMLAAFDALPSHVRGDLGAYCLGAAEAVAVVSELKVNTSAWNKIVDEAINYLRAFRVPYRQVKPYMQVRWEQEHSPSEW